MSLKSLLAEKRRTPPFLVFFSFLVSFSIGRGYSIIRKPYLEILDMTVYLSYLGIILIIIAGWISIHYEGKTLSRINAILLGVGMGVFFDQIGFLLTHFEEYWAGITYTIVIVVSLILLNLVYFHQFWNTVSSELYSFAKRKNLHQGPFKIIGILSFLTRLENNMPKGSDIINIFSGIVMIIAGFLTLIYPELIRVWLATAFFLNGISYIVQLISPS